MDSLNRPINPVIINKCIAVPLLLIAGYLIWLGVADVPSLVAVVSYDLLFLLMLACILVVVSFCILFAAQAFRGRLINGVAVAMAILQIIGFILMFAFATVLFGGATSGPAILIGFVALYVVLLPVSVVAAVMAVVGIVALLRSKQSA